MLGVKNLNGWWVHVYLSTGKQTVQHGNSYLKKKWKTMFKKSFVFFCFRYVRMVNEVTVSLSKTIFEHQEEPTRYSKSWGKPRGIEDIWPNRHNCMGVNADVFTFLTRLMCFSFFLLRSLFYESNASSRKSWLSYHYCPLSFRSCDILIVEPFRSNYQRFHRN